MQPLNHDMDELMRRAAADYPVKPQGADWEKVAQLLDATGEKEVGGTGHGLLKKLLLLLPFILASYVCDRFLQYEYGDVKKPETTGISMDNDAQPKQPLVNKQATFKTGAAANASTNVTVQIASSKNVKPASVTNSKSIGVNGPATGMDILKSATGTATKETDAAFNAAAFYSATTRLEPQTIALSIHPLTIAERPAFVKGSDNLGKKKDAANWKEAYISLLMGPDISRVKTQSMRPAGYNIGVIAGYNFTKHWGVEAGFFWDKKNYFSEGEYFKTDKIYLPQHSTVVQVDGYCAMFEIPLNVRYTWLRKNNSVLSAAAGVSSYLMKKEDYNYVYKRYGIDYAGMSYYNNASKNWFSIANFSMAYEHTIGIKNKIHIEPYVKLPLQGVGIGSLPLRSAGVLVGITRTIH